MEIDDRDRSEAPGGEPRDRRGLWHRIDEWRRGLQDRLWSADEKWAADRGYESHRSPTGWKVTVRDPRFALRQECRDCDGVGRHRITGAECGECGGVGVVTLADPDQGGVS